MRQLDGNVSRDAEDAMLKAIARLDGTPFPTTRALAAGWLGGRVPRKATPGVAPHAQTNADRRETAYCAEVVAITYQDMGLLPKERHASWYDPGKVWSGDELVLTAGY